MKNKKFNSANSAKKFPRRPVIIVTAIAIVAIAAITVASRPSATGNQTDALPKVTTPMAIAENARRATMKLAAQDLPVDRQGKIRPLTADEAKRLADGLKGMLNKSTDGLVEEHNADGSVSIDLKDRFQNVTIARVNADGSVSTACVDNPKAAAKFYEIDPKLLENR